MIDPRALPVSTETLLGLPVIRMLGEGPALYVVREAECGGAALLGFPDPKDQVLSVSRWLAEHRPRVLECPDGKVVLVRDIA